MADEGRCISCGFLGKQDRRRETSVRYPGTYEVEWLERAEPAKARKGVATSANASMLTELVCYRGVVFLPAEIGDTDSNEAALAALQADRKCAVWIKYLPGHDPKEHMAERRLHELEGDRNAFQRALTTESNKLVKVGVILTIVIGLAQLVIAALTATPPSTLYRLLHPHAHERTPAPPPFEE